MIGEVMSHYRILEKLGQGGITTESRILGVLYSQVDPLQEGGEEEK